MVRLYTLAIFCITTAFLFVNGIAFALSFFGAALLPCVAVAGAKWGILRGDRQQKIGVPVIGVMLLAFAYWLSTGISVRLFGLNLSGLSFVVIGSLIGLVGVPIAWGASGSSKSI